RRSSDLNDPVFIRCFDFLAGREPPSKAGLRNRRHILSLLIQSRMIINITHFNTWLVFWVSFVLCFLPFLASVSLWETVLFGLPWSIVFAVSSFYTFSAYFWNMTYFYILCHLIKFRLRETNELVVKSLRRAKDFRKWNLFYIKQRYQLIGDEVKLYNDTYFAKYLFLVVVLMST